MDKWMDDSQLNLRACVMTIQTRDYPSCYHGEEFRTRGPAGTPREDTRSPQGFWIIQQAGDAAGCTSRC